MPEGARLAEIHDTYSTVLQVMSARSSIPFKDEAWTDAFRELLAGLTHYPDFGRLELDLKSMRAEVKARCRAWYEQGTERCRLPCLRRLDGFAAPSTSPHEGAAYLACVYPSSPAW